MHSRYSTIHIRLRKNFYKNTVTLQDFGSCVATSTLQQLPYFFLLQDSEECLCVCCCKQCYILPYKTHTELPEFWLFEHKSSPLKFIVASKITDFVKVNYVKFIRSHEKW